MRVTTQMLNKSSMGAGIPASQGSLLNHIGKTTGSSSGALLQQLQSKAAETGNRSKYEKQGKKADELGRQIQKVAEAEEKVSENGAKQGATSEFGREAESLIEKYNNLLASLSGGQDAMDGFYAQSLKGIVSENKSLLAEVGVSVLKDGRIKADTEKMKNASPEKLQKAFGKESGFMEKLQFMADRVSDRASANARSASGNYSRSGDMNFASFGKYDTKR